MQRRRQQRQGWGMGGLEGVGWCYSRHSSNSSSSSSTYSSSSSSYSSSSNRSSSYSSNSRNHSSSSSCNLGEDQKQQGWFTQVYTNSWCWGVKGTAAARSSDTRQSGVSKCHLGRRSLAIMLLLLCSSGLEAGLQCSSSSSSGSLQSGLGPECSKGWRKLHGQLLLDELLGQHSRSQQAQQASNDV